MGTLTLIRGLPGSGKTTLALELCKEEGTFHLEEDMYFLKRCRKTGKTSYYFDEALVPCAEKWCLMSCQIMLASCRNVVISNCFITRFDLDGYLRLAKKLQIVVHVIEMPLDITYNNVKNYTASQLTQKRQAFEPHIGAVPPPPLLG